MTHAEYMRGWREKHPNANALVMKKYRAGNTEAHRKNEANYKRNHPVAVSAMSPKGRRKSYEAPVGEEV